MRVSFSGGLEAVYHLGCQLASQYTELLSKLTMTRTP